MAAKKPDPKKRGAVPPGKGGGKPAPPGKGSPKPFPPGRSSSSKKPTTAPKKKQK